MIAEESEVQKKESENSLFKKHMWYYCFDIKGNRGTRSEKCPGYYPLALNQKINPNGLTTIKIKTKVTKGFPEFDAVEKVVVALIANEVGEVGQPDQGLAVALQADGVGRLEPADYWDGED